MGKQESGLKARLDAIKHTRARTPIPSPKVFEDGRHMTAKRRRAEDKRMIRDYEEGR